MQFTTTGALEPAIAILTVLATTLLNLRSASRRSDAGERFADEYISRDYVRVISRWRYREDRRLRLSEFFLALARLGGHQNRRSDHPPGWLILWEAGPSFSPCSWATKPPKRKPEVVKPKLGESTYFNNSLSPLRYNAQL